ncbi:Hsp20/alpha crystallin family protein [Beijerinckia mobilis]|uniref:Hsp20/alpha crystallin family protein n=1 Tax=Beijerinckia mobilis TaxID=231434 RepID=UPI00054EA83B|nr:Hsp20/alpha crystallin family protein [Beijerinckia mobilis]
MAEKIPVKTEQQHQQRAVSPSTSFRSGNLGAWTPFESFRREIDQLFDRFAGHSSLLSFPRQSFSLDAPWIDRANALIAPAVDIVEKDKEYEVTAELPGLDEKNIDLRVSDGALTIRGEKHEEKEDRGQDYFLSERRFGSFTRTFPLPAGIDSDKIEANFAKGVLTIKLPKSAEAIKNEKKIEIKAS